MQCSKQALAKLFYNASSSFLLLLLFFYFSSIFLAKFFHFLCNYSIFQRNHSGFEYNLFSDEEAEEEEEEEQIYFHGDLAERDHLVADIIRSGEELLFLPVESQSLHINQTLDPEEIINNPQEVIVEDVDENQEATEDLSVYNSLASESFDLDDEEQIPSSTEAVQDSDSESIRTSLVWMDLKKGGVVELEDDECSKEDCARQEAENKTESRFTKDEKFLVFEPPKLETKKTKIQDEKDEEGEIFGDSCTDTVGSTSKSSSEWRSSINCRDSGTEDPFSSSSRRSCPKWESYTVFQKYDEEMMFLDRISAEKLHETESLRSIQVCPRSISERIVHKLGTRNKKASKNHHQNPYQELEGAYVAQICLTWEALNWNYKMFQRRIAACRDFDPGCPGQIAQQFQQFQVLLQRYVENEPYEQGRRPEVYARMRLLAPRLLQVPEYREDDKKDDSFASRISSASFLMIMEDGIRTFMNFLKADREKPCQIIAAFFRRNKRGSVDPALLHLMKKVNHKKKMKLKDLRRTRKCLRKRKLKVDEEMEILMGLIDLEVVSRVFRMSDISEEQMHWCEEKMSKVRVLEGKLQRDSSPLFFPAH